MSTQVPNINKISNGLCPHGLPPSACPICSNMGGGGSTRVGERPQKAGEMSYHQCAMIGNMMRARELANKRHTQNLEKQAENIKAFEQIMEKLSSKMIEFVRLNNNVFILKPIIFAVKNLIMPTVNLAQKLPLLLQKFQNVKFDIQDKLNAIFGEMKNFLQKKITDIVSNVKSKLEGLFKIFKKHNANDDDTKIDDDKKIFNLRTILHKIIRKKKERRDKHRKNKQ